MTCDNVIPASSTFIIQRIPDVVPAATPSGRHFKCVGLFFISEISVKAARDPLAQYTKF